jgi:hypothetical protein
MPRSASSRSRGLAGCAKARPALRADVHRRQTNPRRLSTAAAAHAFGLCLAFYSSASAQSLSSSRQPSAFINQQRAVEDQVRRQIAEEAGARQRGLFNWGGWYSAHLFVFDDGVESSRTLRRHDLRLWGHLRSAGGAHELHARVRTSLIDFNAGDPFDHNEDDIEGPNLERGVYHFDLAKAIHARKGTPIGYNIRAEVGRDLVQFGHGIALSTPLDHVAIRTTWREFDLLGLFGKSVGSTQDVDLIRPVTRTRRDFLGTQLVYRGSEKHEPFAYALWQTDRHGHSVSPLRTRFDYDSFYFGIGSSGELAHRWRYALEGIYQTGHSFAGTRLHQETDIEAWAFLAEVEHLFPGPRKGRLAFEYLFGSGDPHRTVSPTNTLGAPAGDLIDGSFVGFGYRNTGLSFAPRISNLHMGRVAASCYPWPTHTRLRDLELGTEWFVYHKHHRSAAVSDPTANEPSGFLGWEMDYFVNWRMDADVAWTARAGAFFPGDSFSDRTPRTFLLMGVTWSF